MSGTKSLTSVCPDMIRGRSSVLLKTRMLEISQLLPQLHLLLLMLQSWLLSILLWLYLAPRYPLIPRSIEVPGVIPKKPESSTPKSKSKQNGIKKESSRSIQIESLTIQEDAKEEREASQ